MEPDRGLCENHKPNRFSESKKNANKEKLLKEFVFKYTNIGEEINILLNEKDDNIICTIRDTGIGIKESDLSHIFDRFFRSDDVRNKDIDGSGIGLSIAKMISINLNCKIKPYSVENEGSKFEIIIPRYID